MLRITCPFLQSLYQPTNTEKAISTYIGVLKVYSIVLVDSINEDASYASGSILMEPYKLLRFSNVLL